MKRIRLAHDPQMQWMADWPGPNRGFYELFRVWLKDTGYSDSALHIYSAAARQAIGFLQKPYWQIDPDADFEAVKEHLRQRPITPNTRADYFKGLSKLAAYICLSRHRPPKPREISWKLFTGTFPEALQGDVREFIRHCQHNWPEERRIERSHDLLSHLTLSLRWMKAHSPLKAITDLTPELWSAYLDQRLAAGIKPETVNGELSALKHFVHYLEDNERPVCARFLLVDYLDEGDDLPKDIPVERLRLLQQAIQAETHSRRASERRMAVMDLAWFLLMLHSGLRTGEIRRLRFADIEWQARRVRITQSKGLKDRLVPLSEATLRALQAYLDVRGPAEALPENVFIFRHAALSTSYCYERLWTYSERCGFRVTPHQLRHSCATLLLNAGAPVLTVQAVLGHKQVDTTLGYARLYDGTVAADYYQAMATVERQLALPEDRLAQPPSPGQLLALVDALHRGTLSSAQREILRALRSGLALIAEREVVMVES